LAQQITGVPELEGITISGGEPMMQAHALAELVDHVKSAQPHLSVIVFSGFTLSQLRSKALADEGIAALLTRIDVLIDNLYVDQLNDGHGLRGSRNQNINFLSGRYTHLSDEFEYGPRDVEIHLTASEILLVGVPPPKTLQSFHLTAKRLKKHTLSP
jgi:anaerobic ribonucleoside-triphosphate reductase activating protein